MDRASGARSREEELETDEPDSDSNSTVSAISTVNLSSSTDDYDSSESEAVSDADANGPAQPAPVNPTEADDELWRPLLFQLPQHLMNAQYELQRATLNYWNMLHHLPACQCVLCRLGPYYRAPRMWEPPFQYLAFDAHNAARQRMNELYGWPHRPFIYFPGRGQRDQPDVNNNTRR
ncbi:unnamed protein product [Caenorhabditis auriculariae]|uniref:Uncharacterized protein n=1 Tax=Caenorhabditis auriculariae TaxID=2777116 RepID=A0A8S1HZM3_9PELO|nr:unnamed protein product [Caenorhabditis auriculariae]